MLQLQLFSEDTGATSLSASARQAAQTQPSSDTDGAQSMSDAAESQPFRVFQTQEEFQGYFDQTIGKRLGDHRKLKEKLEIYQPIIDGITHAYGEADPATLLALINDEQAGVPVKETALVSLEEEYAQQIEQENALLGELYDALGKELENLKTADATLYSGIETDALFAEPRFISLLQNGFSVKDAFDALHLNEIKAHAARTAQKQTIDTIRSRGLRPIESALSDSDSVTTGFDPKKLTHAQRAEIRKRVSHGEKIIF